LKSDSFESLFQKSGRSGLESRLKAGLGPSSTLVQDVNGDGIPDILVSDSGSNQVALLPGVGNGFFNDQNPKTFPVGSNPSQVMIGTFLPGPGQEILTVNAGSNDVTVISDFTGTSAVIQDFPTGGIEPVAALAVELVGQAVESLVVANSGDGLFTLLGDPAGLDLETTTTRTRTKPLRPTPATPPASWYPAPRPPSRRSRPSAGNRTSPAPRRPSLRPSRRSSPESRFGRCPSLSGSRNRPLPCRRPARFRVIPRGTGRRTGAGLDVTGRRDHDDRPGEPSGVSSRGGANAIVDPSACWSRSS
jgi:hypothetical protein